jgi:hypothetical protein
MHKIPVGGDEMGLVFTVGVIFMILLALPEIRLFLALSLPIGVVIAIILRLIHRD